MLTRKGSAAEKLFSRLGNRHRATGIVLTLIGMSWLAKRAGWMPSDHAHPTLLWPLLTVAVGLFLAIRVFRGREQGHEGKT